MTELDAGVPALPSLSLLLRLSESTIRQRMQPSLDARGVSLEHWRIMSVLRVRPGLTMSALADATVLPSATITRHMDKLVELGLVVRRVDPADKRRVVAALSPRGGRIAAELAEHESAVEREIARGLGQQRFEALAEELGRLPHLFT